MMTTQAPTQAGTKPSASDKPPEYLQEGPVDIIKKRGLYLFTSALLLIPGIVFMVLMVLQSPTHSPLKLGIDFTGGTLLEYAFEKPLTFNDSQTIRDIFEKAGYTGTTVQLKDASATLAQTASNSKSPLTQQLDTETVTTETASSTSKAIKTTDANKNGGEGLYNGVASIRSKQLKKGDHSLIEGQLTKQLGALTLLQKNSIGPTLAGELLINGLMALVFAYVLIVGYLTFRFQFDYALCAIVALLHDTLFVFGVFAALGYFFQIEVDSLFVTAILTVVGFSVHDTIVVFDRIRENERLLYSKKLTFSTIANLSVNQTLARSINTSITTLIPLFTLYFFGGETTKTFILAIILGVLVGTYSSICVASLVLAWWRQRDTPAGVNNLNKPLTA